MGKAAAAGAPQVREDCGPGADISGGGGNAHIGGMFGGWAQIVHCNYLCISFLLFCYYSGITLFTMCSILHISIKDKYYLLFIILFPVEYCGMKFSKFTKPVAKILFTMNLLKLIPQIFSNFPKHRLQNDEE